MACWEEGLHLIWSLNFLQQACSLIEQKISTPPWSWHKATKSVGTWDRVGEQRMSERWGSLASSLNLLLVVLTSFFMSCFLCVSSCAFWVSMASDERIQTLFFLLEYVQYHLMKRYFHFILKFSVVFSIWMFTSNVLKLHSFIYLWLVHATVHMLKSVDTLKELFLSFYHLNPVIKHRSLGMAANAFIWGAILLIPRLNF